MNHRESPDPGRPPRSGNRHHASSWPDWTDADVWELGADPSPEDEAWWAENAPGARDGHEPAGHDTLAIPPHAPISDREADLLANLAAAQDCLERGLIPADIADEIARTSLIGHDD